LARQQAIVIRDVVLRVAEHRRAAGGREHDTQGVSHLQEVSHLTDAPSWVGVLAMPRHCA